MEVEVREATPHEKALENCTKAQGLLREAAAVLKSANDKSWENVERCASEIGGLTSRWKLEKERWR